MAFKQSAFTFIVLISLCLGCGQRLPEVPPPDSERTFATPMDADIAAAPTVEWCQLEAQSAKFNRKLVRVKGRLKRAFEESTFFNPACPNVRAFFYLDRDADRFSGGEAVARTGGYLADESTSIERDVVVVGEFEDGATEQRGYGHMGGYEMRLIVFRVEQ